MLTLTRVGLFTAVTAILLVLVACSTATRNEPAAPADITGEQSSASPTPTAMAALQLPNQGPAPDFTNEIWLNSEPLNLAALRGKVVLLEFWTFGCINCQRVVPHVVEWYDTYQGDDFTVVSIHYPEFSYEEEVDNVRAALDRTGIEYAVAIDNDGRTWRAYQQRFWPTTYLLDKEGNIRYKHIGEGAYAKTEAAIQALMAEPDP